MVRKAVWEHTYSKDNSSKYKTVMESLREGLVSNDVYFLDNWGGVIEHYKFKYRSNDLFFVRTRSNSSDKVIDKLELTVDDMFSDSAMCQLEEVIKDVLPEWQKSSLED